MRSEDPWPIPPAPGNTRTPRALDAADADGSARPSSTGAAGPAAVGDTTAGRGPSREQVVLLGDDGHPVGVADKATVHDADTPLHLAFSCYVFDGEGRLLVTRRALGKKTWPGVWTNACCGHPGPGEPFEDAVRRRARQELGLELGDVVPVLPDFRYRATDASGVVENEVCPVFAAASAGGLHPDPAEVAEHAWVRWEDLVATSATAPWALSPWSVLQLAALAEQGWRPPGDSVESGSS